MAGPTGAEKSRDLPRVLGPWSAASILIGSIIGSGIFVKTGVVAKSLPSPGWILACWVVAGFLALPLGRLLARLGWPDRLFRWVVQSAWQPALLAVPTFLLMLPMITWQADSPSRAAPEWRIVWYYAAFFAFGWLLYRHREPNAKLLEYECNVYLEDAAKESR